MNVKGFKERKINVSPSKSEEDLNQETFTKGYFSAFS